MWDTTTLLKARLFSGSHSSTLKCVQIKPSDPKIFCSAGRDSQIIFWDIRLPNGSAAVKKYTKPISKKKSYRSIQKQSLESVTGLQFLNCSSYLFTACFAPSGEIHLFDVRKESASLDVYSPDSASKQSFTSITASHSGMLLYGLNTDNQ